MKKQFLFLAFMLIGSFAFANTQTVEKQNNLEINEIAKKDNISLTIDLGDLTNVSSTELKEIISKKLEVLNLIDAELTCTVTVKGEISIPAVGSLSVEVSVSGPCKEVKEKGKEIAEQILSDIRDGLTGK